MSLVRLLATLAGALWSSAAWAQPASDPTDKIRLEYVAPPGCPDTNHFLEAVRSRAGTEWEARPDELARPIDVAVAEEGDRYVASIRFSSKTGERLVRQVTGRSCDDVVNGIALVTALAIRSQVNEALEQSEAPAPAPAPVPPNPPKTAAPARVAAAPAERVPVGVRTGASASVTSGVGPELAFGAGLFAVVEVSRFRLGFAAQLYDSGDDELDGVPVHFRLVSFRLDACPSSLEAAAWLTFEPCAAFEAGWLEGGTTRAAPPRVSNPETATSFWAAPSVLVRGVARFAPGFLQIEGFARVPLFREQFYVETGGPRDVIYEVPFVSFGAGAGLGLRF